RGAGRARVRGRGRTARHPVHGRVRPVDGTTEQAVHPAPVPDLGRARRRGRPHRGRVRHRHHGGRGHRRTAAPRAVQGHRAVAGGPPPGREGRRDDRLRRHAERRPDVRLGRARRGDGQRPPGAAGGGRRGDVLQRGGRDRAGPGASAGLITPGVRRLAEDARIERARARARPRLTGDRNDGSGPAEPVPCLSANPPGGRPTRCAGACSKRPPRAAPACGADSTERGDYSGIRRGLPRREPDVLPCSGIVPLLSRTMTPDLPGVADTPTLPRRTGRTPPNKPGGRLHRPAPGERAAGGASGVCQDVPPAVADRSGPAVPDGHSSPASVSARSFWPASQVASTVTTTSRTVAVVRPPSEVTRVASLTFSATASDHCWTLRVRAPDTREPNSASQTSA